MPQLPHIDDLAGKRACVMGLGSFGGGVSAANFLARHGVQVLVSEQKPAAELTGSLQQLDAGIESSCGGHAWSHFEHADIVVINPAIPPRNEILQRLQSTNKWLTSEIEMFCQWNRGRVIAVTGSNGKSTTTSFIHSLLQSAEISTWLGGNIGISLLDKLDQIAADDWVVLELSSFQLHSLKRSGFRPDIAVLTNLDANHIDWHESESHYFSSKRAIVDSQTEHDWCVINQTDERLAQWSVPSQRVEYGSSTGSRFVCFEADSIGQRLTMQINGSYDEFDVAIPSQFLGEHNQLNLQAAIAAVSICGLKQAAIQKAVTELRPLEYRLEVVAEIAGVLFVNDAKSTTPESAIAALKSMDRPIVLLAGGSDKGVDLTTFAHEIAERVKSVAVMGQVASQLETLINQQRSDLPIARLDSFRASCEWAVSQAQPGDVVLLSAGCASFGWFNNYQDRGQQFALFIEHLASPRQQEL